MGVLPVYHFHAWYPEARKVGCEPPRQYWELSLELNPPQEEKPVLLTAMPSLQPQISPFLISHTRELGIACQLHSRAHSLSHHLPLTSAFMFWACVWTSDFPVCPGALQLLERNATTHGIINRHVISIVKVWAMPCPLQRLRE